MNIDDEDLFSDDSFEGMEDEVITNEDLGVESDPAEDIAAQPEPEQAQTAPQEIYSDAERIEIQAWQEGKTNEEVKALVGEDAYKRLESQGLVTNEQPQEPQLEQRQPQPSQPTRRTSASLTSTSTLMPSRPVTLMGVLLLWRRHRATQLTWKRIASRETR